jgi:hypothetical protein
MLVDQPYQPKIGVFEPALRLMGSRFLGLLKQRYFSGSGYASDDFLDEAR